jgi:hypothetical protein
MTNPFLGYLPEAGRTACVTQVSFIFATNPASIQLDSCWRLLLLSRSSIDFIVRW